MSAILIDSRRHEGDRFMTFNYNFFIMFLKTRWFPTSNSVLPAQPVVSNWSSFFSLITIIKKVSFSFKLLLTKQRQSQSLLGRNCLCWQKKCSTEKAVVWSKLQGKCWNLQYGCSVIWRSLTQSFSFLKHCLHKNNFQLHVGSTKLARRQNMCVWVFKFVCSRARQLWISVLTSSCQGFWFFFSSATLLFDLYIYHFSQVIFKIFCLFPKPNSIHLVISLTVMVLSVFYAFTFSLGFVSLVMRVLAWLSIWLPSIIFSQLM